MDGKATNMPEELLHEREYTRTGIAPAGSSIALADMAAEDAADEDAADEDAAAARKGSDAELGKAASQNRLTNGTTVGICCALMPVKLTSEIVSCMYQHKA